MTQVTSGWYRRGGKRCVDLTLALPILLVAAPILLAVGVLVRITMGAPVLFRQCRPGLNARSFILLKFRTMTAAVDERGQVRPDAERLTRFGAFLRRTSLDEFPELFNVIRGEMSLVGPRPLLIAYLERYNERQMERHRVRPGMTGWVQVNGRNALTWEQKFALDLWYVEHQSLSLDLKILMRTFAHLLKPRGINAAGHATMPEFTGNRTNVRDSHS